MLTLLQSTRSWAQSDVVSDAIAATSDAWGHSRTPLSTTGPSPHWNATSMQRVDYWEHVMADMLPKNEYMTPSCTGIGIAGHYEIANTKSGIAEPLLNGQRYNPRQLIESFLDDGWIGSNGSACSKAQLEQCRNDQNSHNCYIDLQPEKRNGDEFPQCTNSHGQDKYMVICSKSIDEVPITAGIRISMHCDSSIGECPEPNCEGKGCAAWNAHGAKIHVKQKKVSVCVLASYPQTPRYECETIKYQNVTSITFTHFCEMPTSHIVRPYCDKAEAAMKLNSNSQLEFPNIDLHPWILGHVRRWMSNSLMASIQNM